MRQKKKSSCSWVSILLLLIVSLPGFFVADQFLVKEISKWLFTCFNTSQHYSVDWQSVIEADTPKFGSKVSSDAGHLIDPSESEDIEKSKENVHKEVVSSSTKNVQHAADTKTNNKAVDNAYPSSGEYIAKVASQTAATNSARRNLAFAITVTSDGSILDGACVLAYSIIKSHKKTDDLISLVAFIHPSVTISREPLSRLGYM
jgi:hypothetical protein